MTGVPLPQITAVVPVRNEVENIEPLLNEIAAALAPGGPFEVVYVDDGSTDDTPSELRRVAAARPWLRVVRHERSCGQSAAIRSGVRVARAPIVCTLDGDGQNDPRFLPQLAAKLGEAGPGCGLVQGQRVGRKSGWFKTIQSRIANAVRGRILGDGTRDTGCGLKCFPRTVYLDQPFFDGLHRFLPALVRRDGLTVAFVDVVDRPRLTGVSNYGLWDRLWVGLWDLVGVHWLVHRRRAVPVASEVSLDAG